ncbi:MAG: hypothetical protein SGPRY_007021 [Prymnesium sp.]
MLAVMARLHLKMGNEDECEHLQHRPAMVWSGVQVLMMRQASLGMHHEDTHRSAMDVVVRAPDNNAYEAMAHAMRTCFAMLQRASLEDGGTQGFCLSKSLQGMADHVFMDLLVLAKRGTWSRESTLPMLEEAARIAARLPKMPHNSFSAELKQHYLAASGFTLLSLFWQAALTATAAGTLVFNNAGGNAPLTTTTTFQTRNSQAEKLRDLINELKELKTWPIPRRT